MKIKHLFLKNFRNYKESSITFEDGVNYILGKNAQGKTSLLEAIYLLVSGRSFRDKDLNNCISFNSKFFYLEAIFEKQGIDQSLTFYFSPKGRKISYNGTPLKSLASLIGIIPGVLFCPKDINLITGSPSYRRLFINMLLSQSNPKYIPFLVRYTQSIKQRNSLLKNKNIRGIDCWEENIAFYGAQLTEARQKALISLNNILTNTLKRLDFKDLFVIKYRSAIPGFSENTSKETTEIILKLLETNRVREMLLQRTLIGPHRDDIEMSLNNKSISLFASEGQKRSFLSFIKMTEKHFLQLSFPEINPIFCLDDLNISLDIDRGSKILSEFSNLGQVFITSCNSSDPQIHNGHVLFIESGQLVNF